MSAPANSGDQALLFNGLVDFSTTMTVAGDYVVQGSLTLPLAVDGNHSTVQTVVKLNSTTKLTSAAGASGFRVLVPAVAASDVIHVVTTSSAACDQGLNVVKGQVQIYQGDI